ncbi:UNVERIFIED_CONTAM: protein NRT1/ PTR FAMILY 5.10 [Sesamum angustifolium]|uniref:Protein NRT1/ PTR FAMILY 5.10 n=1 Tax=Sesamum angustifolium TaxID=2727405 RepID=A0AAW2L731_9LAMI
MAITMLVGNDVSDAETALLDDVVVRGSVDFNGLPANKAKSGCWEIRFFHHRCVVLIPCVEVAERFAYYGISSNLISYLTGPLGQSTATAAEKRQCLEWSGDASAAFRRFRRRLLFGSISYHYHCLSALRLETLRSRDLGSSSMSAALHSYNSSHCKNDANNLACSPPPFEVIVFFFSLYLVAFAQGGHKPCVQAFGADQFDEEDPEECKAKSSFFNWWYFSMNGGILVAFSVLSYIQENLSWELGFGIPCIAMCLALILFLLGSMTYRFRINSDQRNPFVRIGWVFMKAARNWHAAPTVISIEEEAQQILPYEGFLDKALLTPDGSEDSGNVCSIGDVHDAKAILRLVPIWCSCLGYAVVFSQTSTLFTKQGATMDRHVISGFQIPAASLQALICLSIVLFIRIYDRVLVPIARAITKKPAGISMLQRIGAGIVLSFLAMVIAALTERQRLETAVKYGLVNKPKATIPMSVWWLAPQYLLFGIADAFTMVGLQEFFYDQVPSELKSIGLALYLSIFGIGSFLSGFLISVIKKASSGDGHDSWFSNNLNRAHLDYFYWLLAAVSAATIAAYAYFANHYVYNTKSKV